LRVVGSPRRHTCLAAQELGKPIWLAPRHDARGIYFLGVSMAAIAHFADGAALLTP
jgi:hypothetical protein